MANTNGAELQKVQNKVGESLGRLECLQQSADELTRQLKDLQALMEATQQGNYILRRLHFSQICQRESDVEAAEENTFGWIVGDPEPCRLDITRYHAFDSLRSFLRSDGSIFFFCGKAGSGKSTMMKFLGRHPAVRLGLEEWADGKTLIMVSIFFWSSDSRLQRTAEGFYRTVLFHTLSQCPDLVPDVFPTKSSSRDIDLAIIAPFPVEELKEAFDRLVKLCGTQNNFRFCYLIDGLDEYDGDNQSYRALAQQLVRWSSLDQVKIICSARPYTVFRDAFRDVGITLEFHELTRQDMFTFASQQFATNLTPPVPSVCRDACLASTDQIVTRADGVFSWASLVVRSLINGALDGDTVSKLEQRLEECPDKIEDVFKKMLSKVDLSPSVRRRSNIILYLAAHDLIESSLNALALSWLDDASWFEDDDLGNFPFNQPSRPYTKSEIAVKHAYARKLLHSLTQGLLELKEGTYGDQFPYFRYSIGFFHRSVLDFLRGHCRQPFGSQSTFIEVHSRLRAAEVKFMSSPPEENSQQLKLAPSVSYLYEWTFYWLGSLARGCQSPSYSCLQEFEQAITSNVSSIPWDSPDSIASSSGAFWGLAFRGTISIDGQRSYRWETGLEGAGPITGCSFLHWACYWFQGCHFRDKLSACDVLEELSILLSSSVASDVETTKFLLLQGRRPADCVRIHCSGDKQRRCSVWAVFLRDFANIVNQYQQKVRAHREWPVFLDYSWLDRLSAIIELYLDFEADPDAYFVIELSEDAPPTTLRALGPMYRVTLAQILEVFQPENLSRAQKLLSDTLLTTNSLRSDVQGSLVEAPLPSLQLLQEEDWNVMGVVLPGWDESLSGSFQARVF